MQLAGQREPFLAVVGGDHVEALARQKTAHQIAHGLLVVDHQDLAGRAAAWMTGSAGTQGTAADCGAAAGRRTVKVEPTPGVLSTAMLPPSRWQSRRLIASPGRCRRTGGWSSCRPG